MADLDIERVGTHTDTSSDTSEPSESFDAFSERVSLLHPSLSPDSPDYKSTEIFANVAVSHDDGSVNAESEPRSVAFILSLLLIGVFISSADGSLVMATYTTISSDFHAFGDAAWLTTSYVLASCAFQPIVGKVSDIYGRKPVLLCSYAIFAIASVATGASRSMVEAIGARIVGGVSSAGMVVIVSVLITGEFSLPLF
jgi:hypothetical protein